MVEISVIMPVYNTEKYLKESINCILNQTFKDIELICVDDGSTDNSLSILEEIAKKDERISVFHQENKGGGAARNYALTKATGKYLYFMDSDDILKENALQEFYNIAEEKDIDFLIFQAINYDDEKDEYYTSKDYCMDEVADLVRDKIFNYKDLNDKIFNITVTPWSKFYNRKFVNKTGAQFAEGLIFHDNIFFWTVLFSAKRIYFYRKCLYIRRRHKTSSTGSCDKRYVSTIKINNLITEKFIEFGEFEKFRKILYNSKIKSTYYRFHDIQEDYKEFFFKELKKDYMKIINHEQYEDVLNNLNQHNKNILNYVLISESAKEFELRVKYYDLMKKNKKLKKENKKLKKENKKLKKKEKEILNSKSWKITKQLRKINNNKNKIIK